MSNVATKNGIARWFIDQGFLGQSPSAYITSFYMPLSACAASALAVVTAAESRWLSIACSLITLAYAFGLIPLLDTLLGSDKFNNDPKKIDTVTRQLYRRIVQLYVLASYGMIWAVIHGLCTQRNAISTGAFIGGIISLGTANSMAFTVAHELLHSSDPFERFLSNVLLVPNFYMHWTKSHLQHHCWVATEKDPSSARKGESLYAFWWRSITGNIYNAYQAEARKKSSNMITVWLACPLMLLGLTYTVYGLNGVYVHVGQAILSILFLETVNYIEHYGLTRQKIENTNMYEKTQPKHSWNATTIFTNAVSFNLQRHSDHHAHERKPYYLLENIDSAPQLPHGYPAMMLLALIPPLYFRCMDSYLTSTTTTTKVA